jgi:hypothetical protein
VIRIEHAVRIYRSVAEVFAFVADPTNDPLWSGSVLSSRLIGGMLGSGAVVEQESKFLARRVDARLIVTEYEADRRICLESAEGRARGHECRLFEEVGPTETRLSRAIEAEVAGLFRLAEPLVLGAARKQIETDMELLKALMDARAERD